MKKLLAQKLFAELEKLGWIVIGLTARTTDLSIQDYHSLPGYGSSLIRAGDRSAQHLLHARDETKTSAAMDLGTAFHTAYLEPDKFDGRYIYAKYRDQRKSDYKRWAKQQDATKEILHFDFSEILQGMVKSAKANKVATDLMADGIVEESIFWIDEKTGVLCKSRADFATHGIAEQVVDVKTCVDASFDAFQRTIVSMKYHVQAAIQIESMRVTRGKEARRHSIFAIEKNPPYGNILFPFDEEFLTMGHSRFRYILTQIADWENSGVWPGYPPMLDMYPPTWIK